MKDVVAVIVTYNRLDLLKQCISHLLALENARCDMIIINNNSTDGTREYLDSLENRDIYVFHLDKNIGGAGGFNYGLNKGVLMGYKYIWLMDDDTFVNPDSLEKLLEADKELGGNYGFLSSVAYWKDGSLCLMNRQYTSLRKKLDNFEEKYSPIIMATFVGFFIKASTVLEYGLPIKEFFIWADDLEYSRRISKNNLCYAVPGSSVVHYMGTNTKNGIERDSKDRLWRYKYLYRNEVYVFKREGIKGYLYLFARYFLHSFRIILNGDDKAEKLKIITNSFFSGFAFHPFIETIKGGQENDD